MIGKKTISGQTTTCQAIMAVHTPTGEKQGSGPDTEIQNIGTFIQGDYAITDQLNIQAGVRYQYVQADTDSYLTARKPYTLMAADLQSQTNFCLI